MSDEDQHNRTMNLNAHYAWSFAMWASAEDARTSGNLMVAPIGFYYASFHSAYAYLNAVPGIVPSTFDRMGHAQLSNLIERHLSVDLQTDFDEMRDLREAINYLGMGEAKGKLRILRGHQLNFGVPGNSLTLDEKIERSRDISKTFMVATLKELAALPTKAVDRYPKLGDKDEDWLTEYMQEDIYLGVMSDRMRGKTVTFLRDLLK